MFTQDDHGELKERGISVEEVKRQLEYFRSGIPYLPIAKPATIGDGILKPQEETLRDFIHLYESESLKEKVIKFVPASGAATRMFRDLYAYMDEGSGSKALEDFISGLKRFAFYDDLKSCIEKSGMDTESLIQAGDYDPIFKFLLGREGLNYGNLPKGLVAFHQYDGHYRTAFEEHLLEGINYSRGKDDNVRIHLTVSPEHKDAFENKTHEVVKNLRMQYHHDFSVTFSIQKPSTDTIAVDCDNNPFRDRNGKLVFRPGGHGALLENLDDLDAGIIFIKNIDNVAPDHLKAETLKYKKALGGMLLSFRERIFHYLNILTGDGEINGGFMEEVMTFLSDELCLVPPWGHDQWDYEQKRSYLVSRLDRPLRICGMVRNQGEPGGGPFWVKNSDCSVSLQIVESSQVKLSNPLMKKLFDASTHFNPVDLVCSVKDFRGNKYDLHKFRDPDTGFISHKSFEGREIKALELPGLWNGAMANWNTVFVEVPLITFTPVKTVNDLLRAEHSAV